LTVEATYIRYALHNSCTLGYLKTNRSPKFWKKLGIVFRELGVITSADKLGRSNIWSYIFLLGENKNQDSNQIYIRDLENLENRQPPAQTPHIPVSEQPTPPSPTLLAHGELPKLLEFYGREEQLRQLEKWILTDRNRVVAIIGIGGVGKKSLAHKFIEEIQKMLPCADTMNLSNSASTNTFTNIIWRSLRHAPPIQELLSDLISEIGDKAIAPVKNIDRGISQLISLLRSQRCLLILDDWEVLLDSGRTGIYQKEYSDYGELLRQLGTNDHQSSCIVISREMPIEIVEKERLTAPIYRVLRLKGLCMQAASQLLIARGFAANTQQLSDLVQHYQGHPFALQIVANIVREQFNGNIADFLKLSTLVIDDALSQLLDEQCQSLAKAELEIIYWLAIASRPVTQQQLSNWLCAENPHSSTINALESLRRRSLLQVVDPSDIVVMERSTDDLEITSQNHYTLEPVVRKYISNRFIQEFCQNMNDLIAAKQLSQAGLVSSHLLVQMDSPEEFQAIQRHLFLERIMAHLAREWVSQDILKSHYQGILELFAKSTIMVKGYGSDNLAILMDFIAE
jgi:chromosome segregation and condensation protein ScpB